MLVLVIILALIIFLANIYAVIDIRYADEELHYCIRYSFLKILSSDKKTKKKKVKRKLFSDKFNRKKNPGSSEGKKISEEKKFSEISENKDFPDNEKKSFKSSKNEGDFENKSSKSTSKDEKQSLGDKLEKAEAIIDFIKASEKHIFNLIGNIRFSNINIDFTVAENDAYDCALRYGIISAGIYNILGFVSSYFKTSIDKVNIGLKYNNNNSVYNFSFSLKLKLGTGISAALGILMMYLMKGRVSGKKKEKDILPKECLKMSDHPVNGLMGTAIEKIRDMIDVNTIIGNPISTSEGATIIPVSKVSFGFASGGSDLPSKQPKELFGGAAGAGVSVQPLAFICVSPEGDVKLLQMSVNATKENAMISTLPELIDKISALVGKDGSREKQKKAKTKEQLSTDTDKKEN